MKATVDANIFFASLIREGNTRRLWFNTAIRLFAPEYIIREFLKHKQTIIKKSGADPRAFEQLVEKTLRPLTLVPDAELAPFLLAAQTLTQDPYDIYYFACALKENTIVWSNDKHFQQQHRIPVKTTEQLLNEIGWLESSNKKR